MKIFNRLISNIFSFSVIFLFFVFSCTPDELNDCEKCNCFKSFWEPVVIGNQVVIDVTNINSTIFIDFCVNDGFTESVSNNKSTIQHCSCENTEKKKVYIYSVITNPTQDESVSIKNNSGSTIDISNWKIGKTSKKNHFVIPNGTVLNNGQIITFSATTLGFTNNYSIKEMSDIIYIRNLNPQNSMVDLWHNYP